MDETLMDTLVRMGYHIAGTLSQGGEVVKATYFDEDGHSVDLYNKSFYTETPDAG